MPDVLDIVKQYLIDNGYDGLYADECGCFVDDLAPCCDYFGHCDPGYKVKMNDEGEIGWGVGPKKESDT